MKNMKSYIFAALLFTVASISSCSKFNESSELDGAEADGEGILALSCDMIPETRSTSAMTLEEAKDRLEDYILKIYSIDANGNSELIRYYKPAYEVPSTMYLTSGSYKATLAMQVDAEPVYATRDELEYTYEGETNFTITKDQQTDATITCGLINSVVRMQLNASDFVTNNDGVEYVFDGESGMILIDGNGSTLNDDNVVVKNIVGYVTADSCTTAAEVIASDDSRKLTYNFVDGSGYSTADVDFICYDGYYMLYDYNTSLSYAISFDYCDKTDGEFVTYTSFGKISNVQQKTIYTLGLSCSAAVGGSVNLNIQVSTDEYDEGNDNFSFSPQPTIAGDGLNYAFDYIGGDKTYDLTAIIPMSSVTIERDGESITVLSNGAAVSGVEGVSISMSDDKMTGVLTLGSEFYGGFNAGGENSYTITVIDEKSSKGYVTPSAKLTGMLSSISDVDYWLNTGSLAAYIAESDAQSAKVYCRRSGDSDWYEFAMPSSQGSNKASMTAMWSDAKSNPSGNPYYEMLFGISAGATYECKLEVDGVQRGGIVSVTAGGTKDTIPNASMDNTSLSCFGSDNDSSTNWASGNNSFTSELCSDSSDYGSGCAELTATTSFSVLASGNLFLGQFSFSLLSQSGTVSFGQQFTWNSRPSTFKFRCKSTIGTVDCEKHDGASLTTGDQDIATVYLAIVDWSGRHEVTSGTSTVSGVWSPESDMSVDKGNIIGYAMCEISETTTSFDEIEVPIYYYDKVTNPSSSNISIVVSCGTSKYGDYMVGCKSNKLWVDNFEFGY